MNRFRLAVLRRVLVTVAILTLLPAHALAVQQQGVSLRWDKCFSEGGLDNKMFACNTNAGSDRLVATCTLDHDMSNVSGFEITVEIAFPSQVVPSWWAHRNAGTCRQNALTFNTVPDQAWTNCREPYLAAGGGAGGIGAYTIGYQSPNRVRIAAAAAVAPATLMNLDAWQETFVCNFVFTHIKAVGPGSCEGCAIPACLDLQAIKIVTLVSANNVQLRDGSPWNSSKLALWQHGAFTNYYHHIPSTPNSFLYFDTFDCAAVDLTPAQVRTWGAIKSLYR